MEELQMQLRQALESIQAQQQQITDLQGTIQHQRGLYHPAGQQHDAGRPAAGGDKVIG